MVLENDEGIVLASCACSTKKFVDFEFVSFTDYFFDFDRDTGFALHVCRRHTQLFWGTIVHRVRYPVKAVVDIERALGAFYALRQGDAFERLGRAVGANKVIGARFERLLSEGVREPLRSGYFMFRTPWFKCGVSVDNRVGLVETSASSQSIPLRLSVLLPFLSRYGVEVRDADTEELIPLDSVDTRPFFLEVRGRWDTFEFTARFGPFRRGVR